MLLIQKHLKPVDSGGGSWIKIWFEVDQRNVYQVSKSSLNFSNRTKKLFHRSNIEFN